MIDDGLRAFSAQLLEDYDDPKRWAETLAVLADFAEERGDAIADGLRWMASEGKRPYVFQNKFGCRWWGRVGGKYEADDVSPEIAEHLPGAEMFADFKVWRYSSHDSLLTAVLALAKAYAKMQAERERDSQRVEAHERAHYQGLER